MALKKFAAAIAAYERCRDLYRAQAGDSFTNAQEAQRYRQDRITEIDDQIRQVQSGPQTAGAAGHVRQLQNSRRDIQESIQRGNDMTIESGRAGVGVAVARQRVLSIGPMTDAETRIQGRDRRRQSRRAKRTTISRSSISKRDDYAEADAAAQRGEEVGLQSQPATRKSDSRRAK